MGKKNGFSYDGEVGQWWLDRSQDSVHARAYRKVADFIRDSFPGDPGIIVDYACGPGHLLSLLGQRFRKSRLIGLDGSPVMLDHALRRISALPNRCASRISLIETPLPNMRVLRGNADVAVFCFPNMVPFPGRGNQAGERVCLSGNDRQIAKTLSLAVEPGDEAGEPADALANQSALEYGRYISLNLRRLLAEDGVCIRVEYATMQRHDLSPLELMHVSFEEGSLDSEVDGRRPRQWFRLVASAYFKSGVLEDVYEQTGDERDKKGGYLITVLRAT
jgi:SAM-dependent methyltransferase